MATMVLDFDCDDEQTHWTGLIAEKHDHRDVSMNTDCVLRRVHTALDKIKHGSKR